MGNTQEQIKMILTITRYSIKMFFRDKTAIFFSLFIPLLIMTIFGLLNFNGEVSVQLGIVNEAGNEQSRQVIEVLKKVEALKITEGARETEVEELKQSNRDLVLVLPEGFGNEYADLRTKPPTQIVPQKIELYENQNGANGEVQIGQTIVEKVFDSYTHQVSNTPMLFTFEQKRVEVQEERSYVDFVVPGVAAMSIMQMSIFGVVGAIVSWRERGILKRLLVTPIRPSSILFSQVVTRLIITMMQVSVLISIGLLFFDLNIVGSLLLVFLVALLGGIVFLSMGFALSGAASTQNSVMALGNLIMMPQMFLSGVFFPRESLPEWLNKITAYFPLTYLSHAMREVMIIGATITQIRTDIIGLFVWAIITFLIASYSFRWE